MLWILAGHSRRSLEVYLCIMGPAQAVVLLAYTLVLAVPVKGVQCPDSSWMMWQGTCYIKKGSIPVETRTLYANGTGYVNAVSVCKGIGADLLVLDSAEEAGFILSKVVYTYVYLWCTSKNGLQWTCEGAAGRYYNSESDNSGFWNWDSRYPLSSSTSKRCLRLGVSNPAVVTHTSCGPTSVAWFYICEREAGTFVDSPTTQKALPATDAEVTARLGWSDDSAEDRQTRTSRTPTSTRAVDLSKSTAVRERSPRSTCLKNHVVDTKNARNMSGCEFSCWRHARCHSVNFFARENKCELNSIGMEEATEQDLTAVDGCVYRVNRCKALLMDFGVIARP